MVRIFIKETKFSKNIGKIRTGEKYVIVDL